MNGTMQNDQYLAKDCDRYNLITSGIFLVSLSPLLFLGPTSFFVIAGVILGRSALLYAVTRKLTM